MHQMWRRLVQVQRLSSVSVGLTSTRVWCNLVALVVWGDVEPFESDTRDHTKRSRLELVPARFHMPFYVGSSPTSATKSQRV